MDKQIGKYKILREVGKGGMGIVYKGLDPASQKNVAIKVLPPNLVNRAMVERFTREAAAMVRLKHPNIVEAYEFGMEEGHHFFAMEFVEGENLKSMIKSKGPLPVDEVLQIVIQAAEGLAYAHREEGMAHRDIKPDNVIVKADGSVKIMDFGLVQMPDVTRVTMQGSAVGTAEYMSPEQISDDEIDTRTDIYSLGVTMYEMLVGHPPFQGESFQAILLKHKNDIPPPLKEQRNDIPDEVEKIVLKAMAKDVAQRYQKADELIEAIKQVRGPAFVDKTRAHAPVKEESAVPEKKDDGFIVSKPKKKSSFAPFMLFIIVALGALLFMNKDKILSKFSSDEGYYGVDGESVDVDEGGDLPISSDHLNEAEDYFKVLAVADESYTKGLQLMHEGGYKEAIKYFKQAIQIRDNYAAYYRDLALAYEKTNQTQLALEAWNNLLLYDDSGPLADEAREHLRLLRGW